MKTISDRHTEGMENVVRRGILGPKAQPFDQRRVQPWSTDYPGTFLCGPTGQPFSCQETCWAVGPKDCGVRIVFPGLRPSLGDLTPLWGTRPSLFGNCRRESRKCDAA
jgi:hypothetical protein